MSTIPLSIVHRLPQIYRWLAGGIGLQVEPVPENSQCGNGRLIGLKLLTPVGERAWPVMNKLSEALSDIDVGSSVIECEGEPCLFVNVQDELATTCHLKNCGVVIAELFSRHHSF